MANDTPQTRIAGITSRVPRHDVITLTNQIGTMMLVKGRMRPVIADKSDSFNPVTAAESVNRRADRSPGDGRGVRDQIQNSSVERIESESDHKRARNRHRRAEARAAFDESAERESDQQRLQSPVLRDRRDRILHDLELASEDRDVVKKDRRYHDPRDFQSESHAESEAHRGHPHRHGENDSSEEDRQRPADHRGPMRPGPAHSQQIETERRREWPRRASRAARS